MKLKRLVKRCAYWQNVLGISEWQIAVSISRELAAESSRAGECTYTQCSKTANITLVHPKQFPAGPHPYDMESTLVHELLHIHFAPFMVDQKKWHVFRAQEQAIEAISKALVAENRRVAK